MGAGGALLGAGAGLVGGALLMNAFDDHEQFEQQQAYQQGERKLLELVRLDNSADYVRTGI